MKKKDILLLVIIAALVAALIFVCVRRFGGNQKIAADSQGTYESPPPSPSPSPNPSPSPTQETEPSQEPEPYADKPDIDISEWQYLLVNAENSIEGYTPELAEVEYGQMVDVRIADALKTFIKAARDEGLTVYISSSYRSYAEQEYLYNRKVEQYGGDEETAATIVARPGTSEHQSGLCSDITDKYYATKDSSLEETQLYKWMSEHCAEYGFIVRFPKGKEDITGTIYEPWHFRYVGVEAAAYMQQNNLCFEEFVALYK